VCLREGHDENFSHSAVRSAFQPGLTQEKRFARGNQLPPTAVKFGVFGQALDKLSEQTLSELKRFLESLQAFNTAGKLKSFPHDATVIQAQPSGLACVREVEELLQLVAQVGPTTAYLGKAEAVLEAGHPWIDRMRERRGELMAKITSPKHRADSSFQRTLGQTLAQLKTAYQDVYLDRHARLRLGATDDQRKARLGQDPRLKQLQQLATVEMMPAQQLKDYQNSLFGLKTCFSLTKQELDTDAVCPHCTFRPVEEPLSGTTAGDRISQLDTALDDLVRSWTKTLLTNLQDPTVANNIELASSPEGRAAVQASSPADSSRTRSVPPSSRPCRRSSAGWSGSSSPSPGCSRRSPTAARPARWLRSSSASRVSSPS
jgi:hypothetical protein